MLPHRLKYIFRPANSQFSPVWLRRCECAVSLQSGTYCCCHQVDMMSQGDSIYDFVDKRDHAVWQSNLAHANRVINSCGRRCDTRSDRQRAAAAASVVDKTFCCRMFRARNSRRLPPAWTEHKVSEALSACICIARNR